MSTSDNNGGKLLINSAESIIENDPFEAIFALNLGDFLTEHLISDDLLAKVNNSFHDKVNGLKNQLKELISIYSLDKTLSLLGLESDSDFLIYNSIAKTIAQMIDVDTCRIYLNSDYIKNNKKADYNLLLMGSSHEEADFAKIKSIGYSFKEIENVVINSYVNGKTTYLQDVKTSENWKPIAELNQDKTATFLAVPMSNNAENVGILCIENKSKKEISPEHIKLVEITARLFATSMRLQELIEETETTINDENAAPMELRHLRTELTASIGDLGDEQQMFVEALAKAVDVKCQYSREHSQNVALIAKQIGEYLKLNEKTVDLIYYAGLLQNIGKITLPEGIFSNKGKLTAEEWNKLQNHPNVGVSLLMKINFLSEVVPYVHYHRERWDGKGEPEGLSGLSIPLGSRIIAVADAYQAMVTERPYRKPLSIDEAFAILKKEAGEKWDPVIVDAIVALKQ